MSLFRVISSRREGPFALPAAAPAQNLPQHSLHVPAQTVQVPDVRSGRARLDHATGGILNS